MTFTSGELGWDPDEREHAGGGIITEFERLRGSSNCKDYGIRQLLLRAISALEKDSERLRMINRHFSVKCES